jgi:hypothetical protein
VSQRCLDGSQFGIATKRRAPLLKRARRAERTLMQARSTAFHTAVVRVVMNLTDCADGRAVMVSPVRRYISRIADGRRPSTSSHRNE